MPVSWEIVGSDTASKELVGSYEFVMALEIHEQAYALHFKLLIMFILNVTIKVDWTIATDWLLWVKDVHIPGMLATRRFRNYQLVRLREVDDTDGPTYAIQYYADSREEYQHYLDAAAVKLNHAAFKKWGDRFVMFETLMEVIH